MDRAGFLFAAAVCAGACFSGDPAIRADEGGAPSARPIVSKLDSARDDLTGDAAGSSQRKTAASYRKAGIAEYEKSKFRQAVTDLTKAIEIDPADNEARVFRSLALMLLGNFARAMDDANEIVARAPEDPNHFWLRGCVRRNGGDYKQALIDYSEAIRLQPRHTAALSERGIAHFELGHHQAALDDLTTAIQFSPKNSELYKTRAFFREASGEWDAALDDWNSVIKLCPNAAYALSNRAWVHAARGELDKADADYAAAVAIDPREAGERYSRTLAASAATVRSDFEAPISPKNLLAEFDLAKTRGNVVILPVTIGAQTFNFCLDTGCTKTVFDRSLRPLLGAQLGSVTAGAQRGAIRVRLYAPPKLSLGQLAVELTSPVICTDLAVFRSVFGEPCDGILGLDVLSQFVLRLDVSGRKVCFLRSAEDACGEPITLIQNEESADPVEKKYGNYRTVAISACLADGESALFTLDTGAANETLMANSKLFEELSKQNAIDNHRESYAVTLSGIYGATRGVLTSIKAGAFRHQQFSITTTGAKNKLGLDYFARYVATFDFPNHRLFLAPSSRFAISEAKLHWMFRLPWRQQSPFGGAGANQVCDRCIELNPNSATAYNSRGAYWESEGKLDKAIADYTQAIRLDADDPNGFYNRGNARQKQGDFSGAINDYSAAIQIDAEWHEAYFRRGLAFEKQREFDRAIDDYTEAIKLDPNDAHTFINRGIVWYKKGIWTRRSPTRQKPFD